MGEEMRNHTYTPVADDDRVFLEMQFPTLGGGPWNTPALVIGTPVYTPPAQTRGTSLQGFKVLIVDTGDVATASVEIQELVMGVWATKQSTGVGTAQPNQLFDHNSEDRIQVCRLKITPTGTLPAGTYPTAGYISAKIVGKRDT